MTFVVGVAMLQFIRSLRPAALVADPAAVLALTAMIAAGASAIRWAVHTAGRSTARRWADGVIAWASGAGSAVPSPIVRHALPDLRTATTWLPPAGADVGDPRAVAGESTP